MLGFKNLSFKIEFFVRYLHVILTTAELVDFEIFLAEISFVAHCKTY